jgi:molybdopterin synthase catalytic subunit
MSTQASASRFVLCNAELPVADLTAQLRNAGCGAFVCFEGWVRNEFQGQTVVKLEYSAYQALAVLEGERIAREAEQRFSVSVRVAHRVGSLLVGELAVWIGVSAGHRDAAFTACRWVIDEVKASVPIWKHETYVDQPARWRHEG